MTPRVLKSIVTTVATFTIAACAVSDITGVRSGSASRADLAGIGSTLVECPSATSASTSALVGPLGGVVSAGDATLIVPEGALLEPVNITVSVPASTYVEIDVSVAGVDHFTFQLPVTVAISYARCTRSDILKTPLTAWYIDSATKTLLAPMAGVDDKLTETVTFSTGHLSGYALAN